MEPHVLRAQSGAGGRAAVSSTVLGSLQEEFLGTLAVDVLVGPVAVSSGENMSGSDQTTTTVRRDLSAILTISAIANCSQGVFVDSVHS